MKKKFEAPEIEVVEFATEDIMDESYVVEGPGQDAENGGTGNDD